MIEWGPTAKRLGYADEVSMWKDLYVVRNLSIAMLAVKLDVSRNTIRTSLERVHIPVRKQGGPNNQKLEVTDELVAEIKTHGIAAVAKRLDLSYTTVYKRLYRVRGLRVSDLHPDDAAKAEELTRAIEHPEDDDPEAPIGTEDGGGPDYEEGEVEFLERKDREGKE